jgi:hypothetical protein
MVSSSVIAAPSRSSSVRRSATVSRSATTVSTPASNACLAGRLDPRFDETEELVEDGVLQGDRQRQDAVEPALDGGRLSTRLPSCSRRNPCARRTARTGRR